MFLASLCLFFSISVFGQERQQLRPSEFRDFSGGLVDNVDPLNLPKNASPDLLNLIIDDPFGSIKPRNGISQVATLPSGNIPTGLYEYNLSNGLTYLIATDNQNVYATRDFNTWTTIKTGLSAIITPSFATVRDKLWVANGSTWTFTWDGTTTQLLDGTASTPNPAPLICRYITFWKERVWCARSSSYPSGIQFSNLEDTAGNDIDPSTGSVSWPATNIINVNQDDGSAIYGIKIYRDRLYVFKASGIYQIFFNNEYDNGVAQIATTGAKYNTAIAELDSLIYFLGIEGIYAFDGEQSVRISDPITNKFYSINQLLSTEKFKQWTTKTDWDAMSQTNLNSVDVPGAVSLSSTTISIANGSFETGTFLYWSTYTYSGTTLIYSSYTNLNVRVSSPTTETGISGDWFSELYVSNCTAGDDFKLYIVGVDGSTRTTIGGGSIVDLGTTTINTSDFAGDSVYLNFYGGCQTPSLTAFLQSSTFTARGHITFYSNTTNTGWAKLDNIKVFDYYSTGVLTSDVYNAISVSTWTTFDANYVSNSGAVTFAYRTGHDTADISTQAWKTILPGNVIVSYSSHTYFQFSSTLTASSDMKNSPELEDVSITYYQGTGTATPLYLFPVKNRFWVNVASGTSSTNNTVIVKSKYPSNSFSIYDLQIGPIVKFNNIYYAGASTHSAVYRIDYGSNDNGASINWYLTTRDEVFEDAWGDKLLYEISTDYRGGTAKNVNVGYSIDNGASFTNKTVDMSDSGRNTDRRYFTSPRSQEFRFRVGSGTINENSTILGITGWVFPQQTRR